MAEQSHKIGFLTCRLRDRNDKSDSSYYHLRDLDSGRERFIDLEKLLVNFYNQSSGIQPIQQFSTGEEDSDVYDSHDSYEFVDSFEQGLLTGNSLSFEPLNSEANNSIVLYRGTVRYGKPEGQGWIRHQKNLETEVSPGDSYDRKYYFCIYIPDTPQREAIIGYQRISGSSPGRLFEKTIQAYLNSQTGLLSEISPWRNEAMMNAYRDNTVLNRMSVKIKSYKPDPSSLITGILNEQEYQLKVELIPKGNVVLNTILNKNIDITSSALLNGLLNYEDAERIYSVTGHDGDTKTISAEGNNYFKPWFNVARENLTRSPNIDEFTNSMITLIKQYALIQELRNVEMA